MDPIKQHCIAMSGAMALLTAFALFVFIVLPLMIYLVWPAPFLIESVNETWPKLQNLLFATIGSMVITAICLLIPD
jgi:hypothetical protein